MKKKILLVTSFGVVVAGIGVILAFFYFFRVMNLPTSPMANTIIPTEKFAVTRLFGEITRGDIIVFKLPMNPGVMYCMRVIGLPGETIEVRGMQIFINGKVLLERRVKVDLNADDTTAPILLHELAEEGSGEYRVFYDKTTWEGGGGGDQMMKFAVNSPFKIAAGQYFVMGDSRDNSLDSRSWGTVSQDAMVWKAYLIFSSPIDGRAFTKLK